MVRPRGIAHGLHPPWPPLDPPRPPVAEFRRAVLAYVLHDFRSMVDIWWIWDQHITYLALPVDDWLIFNEMLANVRCIFHLLCISDGFVRGLRLIFDWCSLDVLSIFDRCSISQFLSPTSDFPLPTSYVYVSFRSSFAHFPLPMARPGGMRGAIE